MKRCPRCRRDLPLEAYRRPARRRCRECEDGAPASVALQLSRIGDIPFSPVAGATAARHVRVGLQEARRRSLPFDEAWRAVVPVALLDVRADELEGWRMAFEDTRTAWRVSYGAATRQLAA